MINDSRASVFQARIAKLEDWHKLHITGAHTSVTLEIRTARRKIGKGLLPISPLIQLKNECGRFEKCVSSRKWLHQEHFPDRLLHSSWAWRPSASRRQRP